jgi:hypothetical protein
VPKCEKQNRGVFAGTCSRNATVERKGRHYCRQHDPERHAIAAAGQRDELARACLAYGLDVKDAKRATTFLVYRDGTVLGTVTYLRKRWSSATYDSPDLERQHQTAEAAVRHVAGVTRHLTLDVAADLDGDATFTPSSSEKLAEEVAQAVAAVVSNRTGRVTKSHCRFRGQVGRHG